MFVAPSETEVHAGAFRPADIAEKRFAVAKRGYDAGEVRLFLKSLADHVKKLQGEVEWERARGQHLERRKESAQDAAYGRLSRDFQDVVKAADQAAQRVLASAEEEARMMISSVRRRAEATEQAARAAAEKIAAAARRQADDILEGARAQAEAAGEKPGGEQTAKDSQPAPPVSVPARPQRAERAPAVGGEQLRSIWQPAGHADSSNGNGAGPADPGSSAPGTSPSHAADAEGIDSGRPIDFEDLDIGLDASLFDSLDDPDDPGL
jgi:DivIVA domain-containing protein